MKLVFLTLALTFIFLSDGKQAFAGNDGHGGDTDAVEFVAYALNIGTWLQNAARPELKPAEFLAYANMLSRNLDGAEKSKLEFVDEELKDKFGTPKMALFSTADQPIRINRTNWQHLKLEKKYELVNLEIFGQIGVKERYARAADVASHYAEMESNNRYELQMAFQDFARFKPVHVTIDASGFQSSALTSLGLDFINQKIKKQSLNSDRAADIPKLVQLFSKPKYKCESQILLAVHRILLNNPDKIEEIVQRLHQNNLNVVEADKKNTARRKSQGYYVEGEYVSTESPMNTFRQIYIGLEPQTKQQMKAFLTKWDQAKSLSEKQTLINNFSVDIFKEPNKGVSVSGGGRPGAFYSNIPRFEMTEVDAQTGKFFSDIGTPYHWTIGGNERLYSANEEEERCTLSAAKLSYIMGIQVPMKD
jgi:hypothetical protein